jgi:L-threonylcarbamoyladenylate synthase
MTSLVTTDISKAANKLADGHLCAIPTETVYGLAADANNLAAITQVFEAKGRPSDHPLIVHVANFADVKNWLIEIPEWAEKLAQNFWPGPLTLVGKRAPHVLDAVTGGQDTVAIRVPAHPVAHQLLEELKTQGVTGLVAPSANKFGHVSPTTSAHVETDLGEYLADHQDLILDGGSSEVGLESTIVLITGQSPVILRPGAITQSDIEKVTGLNVITSSENKPRVSGSLDSHYAPKAKVVLVQPDQIPNETNAGFIGLADLTVPNKLMVLLAAKNLEEYAANLYQALRAGDLAGLTTIYAVLPTGEGLATAITDRLTRAAH